MQRSEFRGKHFASLFGLPGCFQASSPWLFDSQGGDFYLALLFPAWRLGIQRLKSFLRVASVCVDDVVAVIQLCFKFPNPGNECRLGMPDSETQNDGTPCLPGSLGAHSAGVLWIFLLFR